MGGPLRIAFMGTPDFAATALQTLLDSSHEVVCVYSQPPRPKGRGHKLQQSPVHDLAAQHGIPVFTPTTLKSAEAQAEFSSHDLDIAVVAAYGLILPKVVLEAPKYGCLNIHASLLPRWRGAAPIQRAILAGDAQSGVTIMQMDEGLDTGGMIAKSAVDITPETTSSSLHDALANAGAALTLRTLDDIAATQTKSSAQPQDETLATYAAMLRKEEGKIDWQTGAAVIERQVRALHPWPGVWCEKGDMRYKISAAKITDNDIQSPPGTVLDKAGHVACGDGRVLQILTIQPAGKQAMDFASAVNGGYIAAGDVLG
ncbi:MAG: methionyl-tRNA formyltransferase [Alphaproteobacteria bacterium]|nr:methionyl-tRNA formyltransferase [Alphaproteobacteria bacterium]